MTYRPVSETGPDDVSAVTVTDSVVRPHRSHLMAEADVASRQLAQFLLEEPHQLPLLALHAIGMVGVARQHATDRTSPPARSPDRETARSAPFSPTSIMRRHDAELVQQIQGRGWNVDPRSSITSSGSAVTSTVGMPRRPNAKAAVRPTGPAPTTITQSFDIRNGVPTVRLQRSGGKRRPPNAHLNGSVLSAKSAASPPSTIGWCFHAERPTTARCKTGAET